MIIIATYSLYIISLLKKYIFYITLQFIFQRVSTTGVYNVYSIIYALRFGVNSTQTKRFNHI